MSEKEQRQIQEGNETEQNLLEFFDLLLKVDKRINSKKYKQEQQC